MMVIHRRKSPPSRGVGVLPPTENQDGPRGKRLGFHGSCAVLDSRSRPDLSGSRDGLKQKRIDVLLKWRDSESTEWILYPYTYCSGGDPHQFPSSSTTNSPTVRLSCKSGHTRSDCVRPDRRGPSC